MRAMTALLTVSALLSVETSSAQSQALRLRGTWQLSLWVTEPARKSTGPRAASGEIQLKPLPDSESPAGSIVYSVTNDSTLRVMFGPQLFGPPRAVLTASGAVELVFNPFVDHGAFRLNGVEHGDSIVGEWHRTNFADDGYRGLFSLVRKR